MAYSAPPDPQKSAPASTGGSFTELNIRHPAGAGMPIRLDDGFVKLLEEQLLAGLAGDAAAAGGFLTGWNQADALYLAGSQPFASAGLQSLQSVVNERAAGAAPQGAIGIYILRREPNLALTGDDLALFRERCPQGTRLLLLAGPGDGKIPAAVIYLGQEGNLFSGLRTVEWPVNLRALGAGEELTPRRPGEPYPQEREPRREKRAGVFRWVAGSAALACVVIAFWSLRPPVRPGLGVSGAVPSPAAWVPVPGPAAPARSGESMPEAAPRMGESAAAAPVPSGQAARQTPPRPLVEVTPAVPPAILGGVQGVAMVSVRVEVNSAGKVTAAETVSPGAGAHARLASAVVDAVRRWQFEPARENGRPVAGVIVLHFKYTNP